jgi:outer membrane autotransporter protein
LGFNIPQQDKISARGVLTEGWEFVYKKKEERSEQIMRKGKNLLLKAAVLTSLMATPGMAWANNGLVAPVSVDGEYVSTGVTEINDTTCDVGKTGSTVILGGFSTNTPEVFSVIAGSDQPATVTVSGKTITSYSMKAQKGGVINVGDESTESVTITGITNGGTESSGLYSELSGSSVTVKAKTINISTQASAKPAVVVMNSTQETDAPADAASMTLTGDTINISAPTWGIGSYSNGQLTINGNLTVDAKYAIDARGYSTTNINTDGAHSTVINGDIVFETPNQEGGSSAGSGNIINATVNLNLTGEDSVWNGRSYEMYTEEGADEETEHLYGDDYYGHVTGLSLTMRDGATWNATGNNIMNNLDAEDSTINVKEGTEYVYVGTATLTNSTANINADGASLSIDKMVSKDSAINVNGENAKLYSENDVSLTGGSLNLNGKGAAAESKNLTLDGTQVNGSGDSAVLKADTITLKNGSVNLEGANAKVEATSVDVDNSTLTFDGKDAVIAADQLDMTDSTMNFNESGADFSTGSVTLNSSTINFNGADNALTADELTLNDGTLNFNTAAQNITVNKLSGTSGVVNTNSLDNHVTVGESTIDDLTVHGTSNIADAIAADRSNAQKLAAVVSDTNNNSVADRITTDEGILSGSYNFDVVDGKVVWGNNSYTPNQTNVGIASLAAMNLMTWRQENNDMNKRLGELRDSEGQQGVWARMVRGEAKYGLRNMKNQYNYYQVGYDHKIGKNWTLGVAYSKTDGSTSFGRGTADNDHDGVAVYGSWLGDDGSFVDLIGKYSHIDTEYYVNSGAGSGDYDNDAFNFSAEYGKRFHGSNGFWIEPQVELTYGTVDSADYTTKRGVKVHNDSVDSFVGRLGFALGKDIKAGHIYARASYLYDFDGESDVTMTYNGAKAKFSNDIGGGWWEVGIGANLNLSKATHLYIDVEKTYGGDVTTPWQWGVGLRYSF